MIEVREGKPFFSKRSMETLMRDPDIQGFVQRQFQNLMEYAKVLMSYDLKVQAIKAQRHNQGGAWYRDALKSLKSSKSSAYRLAISSVDSLNRSCEMLKVPPVLEGLDLISEDEFESAVLEYFGEMVEEEA